MKQEIEARTTQFVRTLNLINLTQLSGYHRASKRPWITDAEGAINHGIGFRSLGNVGLTPKIHQTSTSFYHSCP
jgi:hypothetical protein